MFLLGGVREGIGNTLLLEGSSKDASPGAPACFLRGFRSLREERLRSIRSTPEAHREGSGIFR